MADENDPATKGDLTQLADRLRSELASKSDLAQLEDRLRSDLASKADLAAMETRVRAGISDDLGRALAIQREEFQAWARTFDDKYKDLPARMTLVERDVADLKAQLTPPPPPATRKRPATSKRPATRGKKAAR
jgi:hypothetical protein